mmetsp:Transcript_23751/g.63646  ORF Transcript_23751/g.63646 Transcript_23751/m.63646 type:complete len:232 (+) Transcript_23751:2296-2991(+)
MPCSIAIAFSIFPLATSTLALTIVTRPSCGVPENSKMAFCISALASLIFLSSSCTSSVSTKTEHRSNADSSVPLAAPRRAPLLSAVWMPGSDMADSSTRSASSGSPWFCSTLALTMWKTGDSRTEKLCESACSSTPCACLNLSDRSRICACSSAATLNVGSALVQAAQQRSAASKSQRRKCARASSSWPSSRPGTCEHVNWSSLVALPSTSAVGDASPCTSGSGPQWLRNC